jgi:acyl carrier protein
MGNEILEKITLIFSDVLQHNNFKLTETTTTEDVDGWESATHMMIITEIEEQFNIEFELSELWSMKNIGDLLNTLKVKI